MKHLGSQATPGLLLDAIYMAHAARALGQAKEHVHETVVDMFIRPRLPEDVDDSDFDYHSRDNDEDSGDENHDGNSEEENNEQNKNANPAAARPDDADTAADEGAGAEASPQNPSSAENDSGDTSREDHNDYPHNDDAAAGVEARIRVPVDTAESQP